MKQTRISIQFYTTILLLALGLSLSACKSSGDRSRAQIKGDRQVAANVKEELAKDSKTNYLDVEPVVYDGAVQLGGFVATPEQKARAAELALRAKGVREVVNSISLKPTPTGPSLAETNAPPPPASEEAPQPSAQAPSVPEQAPNPNP